MPNEQNPHLVSRSATLGQLQAIARAGQLYGVIDACDQPAVPEKARSLTEQSAISLYRGSAEEEYWAIAPYLFHIDTKILQWILEVLWSEPWGIFAIANADLEAIRTHFRRFLKVESPEGEQWLFRYYDPRVLRTFLSTSTPIELRDFLGPIQAVGFAEPGEKGAVLMSLKLMSTFA